LAQAQALAAEIQYKIEHPGEAPVSAAPQASSGYSLAADGPKITGSGTGFIITKDGYLFTCLHVIENADIIKVAVGRDLYPAKLIRADANCDLALLKIDGAFNSLAFSPKRTAAMGEDVFTVGFPNPDLQGMNPKLTKGSINSLTGLKDDLRLYQISVPVQPGNSGGPLLDANGNVCGIVVAMLDAETAFEITGSLPQNVNYAVKSTYAQTLLDTLPEVGKKLPAPSTETAFDVVTASVEKSIVMVLTYE
jgi:S1-C subfamily serine protease